ncbi:MGMT family protein [Candidatus Woesearchaeota archaeon]|nr:MGMT family protein [Candidatus Woesearchaeota archaeon]
MKEFSGRTYALLRQVPKGRVTTYKELASALGTKAYQAVGQAMRNNPYAPEVPCHRVVKSDGSIGGFGGETAGNKITEKIELLRSEGVQVEDNKVKDFEKIVFRF